MSDTVSSVNPLLNIDTGFQSYLNAYTRSTINHMIDGQLDYAFDSDFAVRQKINGLAGWGKLSKAINSADISAEAKQLFMNCEQAGSLKYPAIYDILKRCCERLELNLPIMLVRKDYDRPLAYSISSEMIEPSIVITRSLLDICSDDELEFLIGSECGRIQNNHPVYNWAYTYINFSRSGYRPAEKSYKGAVNSQIVGTLSDWVRYADMTADRAGMICMHSPGRYIEIMCSLLDKGYVDFYGRTASGLTAQVLEAQVKANRQISARSLMPDMGGAIQSRIIAAAEFLGCESLFRWRTDLQNSDEHACAAQICDVRCNILLASGGQ